MLIAMPSVHREARVTYARFAFRRRSASNPPPARQLSAKPISAAVSEPVNGKPVVEIAVVVDVGRVVPSITTGGDVTVDSVVEVEPCA
jgi:hypothetical protein